MRTIVLDTNVLIDNVHGKASWLDRLIDSKEEYRLVVPTIVVAEYLVAQEVEIKHHEAKSKQYLQLFQPQDLTFEVAGVLARLLRRKTYPPGAGTADLIVASTAIFLDSELATRNKSHFQGIPGLRFFDSEELEI